MKAVTFRSVLWLGGGVAMAASVAMTFVTLRQLEEGAVRLKEKIGNVVEMRRLGESTEEYRAAQRAFEDLGERVGAAGLDQLVVKALSGRKPDDVRRHRESFRPGWAVEQVEIYVSEVPFKALVPLLETAESLRPPWRLTKCVLSGSPRAVGTGRATLQFERVCRE